MQDYESKYRGEEVDAILDDVANKVDKVEGKGLSTEDFTTELKNKVETATDIVASQIFLELHSDFDDFQVFSHKSGYEEHNREVCQRLIENCFADKTPNNEVFFVTINGLRDGVPYMETAILESQAEEIVRASFVKGNIVRESSIAASIGILSIDVEGLRAYAEYGEDTFYWKYSSTRVPSIDAIGSEEESDVYVTEFNFEQITNGAAVNVSPELVSAIYNKRIIVIPSSKTGNHIATNTYSAPPDFPVQIRMQIATGVYIYDVTLSAKGAAPQTIPTVVNGTNLLHGRLNTINGASIAVGVDMQLVASISLNGKTYTPTKGAVDLGSIKGGETNTMVSASWGRLVSARDSGELIPGTYYRIIDYVTTTIQENTDSAGNLFDVIVLALDEHTLSEEAYAIQSERDTDGYFANSNLAAWKLWYCLDNDTSRFAWADEENGRGVIYRMIDEFGNDCPYDFKNILFTRYELEAPDEYFADETAYKWLEQLVTNVRAMFDAKDPSFVWAGLQLGEYYWEDDYSEVFSQATSKRKMFYTFSDITDFENKELTSDSSLTSSTYNNKIGYTYSIKMYLPNNVFFGENCCDNSFGNSCTNNSIGNWSYNNTFGNNCFNNTFGENCHNNKFYDNCYYIIFSRYCHSNTFGIGSYCNSFGNDCTLNVFGKSSYSNSFGNNYYANILGSNFAYNSFLNNCSLNSFGNDCQFNILSSECRYNNFGNSCSQNRFGMGYFYKYNTFGEEVQHLHLTNDEQGFYDNVVQNYSIANGIQGTYEEPLEINAERNRIYETTIARNSNGEIVQFCEGDNGGVKNIQLLESDTIDVLEPNKIYVYATSEPASITINSFSTTDALTEEYVVQFRTFSLAGSITLPSGVMWANGVTPTLEGSTLYELSIVKTHIGETDYFKAVLTPFK